MEIISKKFKDRYKIFILFFGFFIIVLIFLNYYKNFQSFNDYALYGIIEYEKKARVGKVFKFKESDRFYSLYIKGEHQNLISIGDSISKGFQAKEIKVYRKINEQEQMTFYASFPIQ